MVHNTASYMKSPREVKLSHQLTFKNINCNI